MTKRTRTLPPLPLPEHVFCLDPETSPYCRCSLPKANRVHVPAKDETLPLF